MAKKVFIIPDAHFPHSINLDPIYEAIEREKPDVVVQCGDLLDLYSFSKFSRSYDLMTPKQELLEGRKCAEDMWSRIRKICPPRTKYHQLKGNHCSRIEKRIYDKFPEIEYLVDLDKIFKFNGIETIDSDRKPLIIDGVYYVHGWLSQLGQHLNYFNASVVHGHTHRAGIIFVPRHNTTLFELDAGYLADPETKPLSYTSSTTTRWVHGHGIVDKFGPRFCPILL